MKISKFQMLRNSMIKAYRNYKLYKSTSQIDRDIYINRQGVISDLECKYGKEDVAIRIGWGYILPTLGDKWSITKTGINDIEVFNAKPSLWESIVSVYFALLKNV